ncbi:hypothetical protein EON65_16995 [archaeon]|nr:MAG: hypothetical protein EON65_16995 [archaeon]
MARIRQLSQEVDQLTYQLQQERIGRDAMATASRRADESLAKVLADAWAAFDTEREAHQATKDDAEEFEREYEYYRDLYHRTEERLYREMVSMKEAMVTVQRVQRELTKVREDNEVILDRLVKAKVGSLETIIYMYLSHFYLHLISIGSWSMPTSVWSTTTLKRTT